MYFTILYNTSNPLNKLNNKNKGRLNYTRDVSTIFQYCVVTISALVYFANERLTILQLLNEIDKLI